MTESRRQQLLHVIVDVWDHQFDPCTGLLPAPATLSCNLYYALALLETAERSRMGRAEALISRITASTASASRNPSAIGLPLALVWHRHRTRLSVLLRNRIRESIIQSLAEQTLADSKPLSSRTLLIHANLIATDISSDHSPLSNVLPHIHKFTDTLEAAQPDGLPLSELISLLLSLHALESHIQESDTTDRLISIFPRLWGALEHLPAPRPLVAEILLERAAPSPSQSLSIEDFRQALQQRPQDIPDILQVLVVSLNLPCPA